MGALLKIKNLFGPEAPVVRPFKQKHYLNSLPARDLNELLLCAETEAFLKMTPRLERKKVLFANDQRHKSLFQRLNAKEPGFLVNGLCGGEAPQVQRPGSLSLLFDLQRPCFAGGRFDLTVCPFSLLTDDLTESTFVKMSQVLTNGGRMIVGLRHPQLSYMLFNQNPSRLGIPDTSLSRYFSWFKKANLFFEDMYEAKVNSSLKSFFVDPVGHDHYHDYKDTSLVLVLRLVRYKK